MIRVLHSTPVWLPQTQTWMYNQIRYLPADIQAHIACERTENLEQFGLPNIHCAANQRVWRLYLDKVIRKLRLRHYLAFSLDVARSERATILHSHFGPIGWRDIGLAKHGGMKHVVTFYGQDVSFLPRHQPEWTSRYRDLFNAVDLVLCEGPHMAQSIRDMGCAEEKVRVHRLGIAIDEIEFSPLAWRPGTPFKVLMASSFREKKGIPYALEALSRLKDIVPLEITLIGDAGHDRREATEKDLILRRIKNLKLTENINLPGYQPHARLLQEAKQHHIFLSPSVTAEDGDTEGGAPVSLIEMSATGMLVVSTTHCDIPQVVKHRETGMLTDERNIEGLVENMKWLIENPSMWTSMQTAARKRMESLFDARLQGEKLAAIYAGLAKPVLSRDVD